MVLSVHAGVLVEVVCLKCLLSDYVHVVVVVIDEDGLKNDSFREEYDTQFLD